MLTFSGVSKAFDGRPALAGVTFSVPTGSRTAVVGVNGSGKSTLLRLAAGLDAPDSGTVALDSGRVGYVPQDYGLVASATVDEYLRERAGLAPVERRLRELERALAGGDPGAMDRYADALDEFAALGGYELEGRLDRALDDLGLPASLLPRRLDELSGGQQVRVGLAGVLASRYPLYLLDEPTNNLDLEALERLETFVRTADATFLLVSHDRAFLEATASDVVELDEYSHAATVYGVPFAEYLALREQVLAARSTRYRDYLAEVERLSAAVRVQRARAAQTKDRRPRRDNDRYSPHFFAQTAAKQAGKAMRSLEQRLDRLEEPDEPRTGWELRLSLAPAARSGEMVVDAREVGLRLGSFALGPLSLTVHWRDRIALAGPNGAGKSLLIALLTQARRPDRGAVRLGAGVVPGVLSQGGADLAGAGSGLAVFRRALGWPESESRTLLAKFDLGAGHMGRAVDTYSPGERCRLGLAILMAAGANWLVLDEPTNHLDLEATEQLEQALQGFQGTLLVVSHDRTFLDRIGITRRLELDGGVLRADQTT